MFTHCPFCHKIVLSFLYSWHRQRHTRLRPDGQMKEHITLPPEQRSTVSLQDVPRVYYHSKCETCTQMPEEIIRSYLKNPYIYNSNTFCCGCGTYINQRELTWIENDESLEVYFTRLKEEYRNANKS